MPITLGEKIRTKFPTRIPVIFEPSNGVDLVKTKFLVPDDTTVSQMMTILRKYVQVGKCEAIFLMINNVLPANSEILSTIYEKHKNEEDMLVIAVTKENTFG